MSEPRRVSLPNEPLLTQVGELIAAGHNVTIRVRGNSMNPFFVDRRDEVVLSPFQKEDLKPGVIILARDEYSRFVLHRIIKTERDQLILMGDGNIKGIEHTYPKDVLGMVTGGVRNGKQIKCSGKKWERASNTWRRLLPVRRWILAVWRRLPGVRKYMFQPQINAD